MEFFVNSQKIDITIENEKKVGDILKAFETEFAENNATTIGIKLNDKNVTAEEFDAIYEQDLTDSTKIEFTIVSLADIRSAFSQEANICNELSEKIKNISVNFQSGKDKEANVLIAELADFIDSFCRTAKLSSLFPEDFKSFIEKGISGTPVASFFQDFAPILNDFEEAIKSNDTVLIGDLAEYEISPRLQSIEETIKQL